MAAGGHQAVTPDGVRDGDPASLRGLVGRRGPAVLAFCEAVCEPEPGVEAAAETFARFRAAVVAADDPAGLDPEVLLLSATRHSAAGRARRPTGRGRRRGGGVNVHAQLPELLASRADDLLDAEELDALAAHLERCEECGNLEADFRRAERAYRSPPDQHLSAPLRRRLVAALADAAPLVVPGARELLESGLSEDWYLDGDEVFEPTREPPVDAEQPPAAEPLPAAEQPPAAEPVLAASAPPVEAEPAPAVEAEPAAPVEAEPALEPDPAPEAEPTVATGAHPAVEAASTPSLDPEPAPPIAPEPAPGREPARELVLAPVVASEAPNALPRTRRHVHLPHPHLSADTAIFRFVLPGVAIAIAIAIVLAIAGVLGGQDPAPSTPNAGVAITR